MTEYAARDPAENPLRPHLRAAHDLGLTYAFEALNAPTLAWSEERAIWRTLVRGVWVEDKSRFAYQAVREFVRLLEMHAQGLANDHPDRSAWAGAVKRWQYVDPSKMLSLAKTGLARPESRYDVDAMRLNTPGGVVDLATAQLDETPRPDEHFTKSTSVPYVAGATSAAWEALLKLVLPDDELRAYAQRCLGASLSGRAGQRLVFALHGPPRSGKSTVTGIVAETLGTYSAVLHHGALAVRQYSNSGHTSELIPLVGARYACVHELPERAELNAALLKTIVGGEEFSVSEKGKPYFAVRFCAKLFLVSNYALTMSATDDAAWDRVHLVPFEHPIEQPDADAIRALAEDEGVRTACLAWLVEGWRAYRAAGLGAPARVVQMAGQQRAGNALIGEWLEAEVDRDPAGTIGGQEAFRACRDWLVCSGRPAGIDPKRFVAEMRAAGFEQARMASGRVWVGVSLRGRAQNPGL